MVKKAFPVDIREKLSDFSSFVSCFQQVKKSDAKYQLSKRIYNKMRGRIQENEW